MIFSWKTLAVLAAIWLVAGIAVLFSRSASPSPEKLTAYLESHPLTGLSDPQRTKILEKAAVQLNSLNFEQRRELRDSETLRRLFVDLKPPERSRFLDLTLPEGFRQMMSALNKMDPAKRQKIVQQALDDISKNTPQSAERLDEKEIKKILSEGVSSFYENANADVKLDFAPVLEAMQRGVQNLR